MKMMHLHTSAASPPTKKTASRVVHTPTTPRTKPTPRAGCWSTWTTQLQRKTFSCPPSWLEWLNPTRYSSPASNSKLICRVFNPFFFLAFHTRFICLPFLLRLAESVSCTTTWWSRWSASATAAASAVSSPTAWVWAKRCRSSHSSTSCSETLELTLCSPLCQ